MQKLYLSLKNTVQDTWEMIINYKADKNYSNEKSN